MSLLWASNSGISETTCNLQHEHEFANDLVNTFDWPTDCKSQSVPRLQFRAKKYSVSCMPTPYLCSTSPHWRWYEDWITNYDFTSSPFIGWHDQETWSGDMTWISYNMSTRQRRLICSRVLVIRIWNWVLITPSSCSFDFGTPSPSRSLIPHDSWKATKIKKKILQGPRQLRQFHAQLVQLRLRNPLSLSQPHPPWFLEGH